MKWIRGIGIAVVAGLAVIGLLTVVLGTFAWLVYAKNHDGDFLAGRRQYVPTSLDVRMGLPEDVSLLSAEEVYLNSIELLSDGRQRDAERLIEQGIRYHFHDPRIQFARGVLARSRWNKRSADVWFSVVQRTARHSPLGRAAWLSRELDRGRASKPHLEELIQLADEHPNEVYLLWLSAIQCREQKNGQLGRRQYQTLLQKFRVGPVMLHQTYANILTEYLKEYDKALDHRYLAVALESRSWTVQGLANTLTDMERYDLANAVWPKAVRLNPRRSRGWYRWAFVQYKLGRYDRAMDTYAAGWRIAPSDYDFVREMGVVSEATGHHAEMLRHYQMAADAGHARAINDMGRCYAYGMGVEQCWETAVMWYHKASEQGCRFAASNLAHCYEVGNGVEQDFSKTAYYYQLAVERGNISSVTELGRLYSSGRGVERDPHKAIELYRSVLEQDENNSRAMNNLAWTLVTDADPSVHDYPQALRLAKRSVELNAQWYSLNTLAFAYNANGMYEEAIATQERRIEHFQRDNPGKELPEQMVGRLLLYQENARREKLGAEIESP